MASFTIAAGNRAAHDKTLSADTVDTVTFTDDYGQVEIVTDGAAKLYCTIDGSTPTVGGAKTLILPAAIGTLTIDAPGGTPPVVKLISSGTPTYSVVGI